MANKWTVNTEDNHIARLESEIRYLKGLLDKNGIPYDYEAFAEAVRREEPLEMEFPVLTAEQAMESLGIPKSEYKKYQAML